MKYWISPDIKYKTFKEINDKLSPQDLSIKGFTKIIWQMIRDRQINCFIDTKGKEEKVFITRKPIPKKAKIANNHLRDN